jgi:preprotein translocase subunit SecG
MAWLTTLLIVVQVIAAIAVVVLVLLQHGKGADMGAAFGGGASGSLFGATGSANFLSRSTGAVATVFFLATLGLAYTSTEVKRPASDTGGVMGTMPPAAPAAPAPKDIPTPSGQSPQSAPAQPATPQDGTVPKQSTAPTDVPPASSASGKSAQPADIPK